MPVRSLTSSVLKWPDREMVFHAFSSWAQHLVRQHAGVLRLGFFGSYARGDWGVGSDLDVVIVLEHSDRPFGMRASKWNTTDLPVPADLLVYTREEWNKLNKNEPKPVFLGEIIWVYAPGR